MGLTQVLSDGTTTYTYGLGRISQQQGSTPEYFLGDALGSVRQMTDQAGGITVAKSYSPYGEVTTSAGISSSAFAYTGEMQDANGLTYLRARYYNPLDGRFLSRDTWAGDVNRPLSLNRWMYVEGNPVNAVDPSGYITEQQAPKAKVIKDKLKMLYNVHIERDWGYKAPPNLGPGFAGFHNDEEFAKLIGCTWKDGNWTSVHELELVFEGVKKMAEKLGGPNKFRSAVTNPIQITIRRMKDDAYIHNNEDYVAWTTTDIKMYNDTFDQPINAEVFASGTTVHELAHVWDTRQIPIFKLSANMAKKTKSYNKICDVGYHNLPVNCRYEYDGNAGEPPPPLMANMGFGKILQTVLQFVFIQRTRVSRRWIATQYVKIT